jgi:hypothetical protein
MMKRPSNHGYTRMSRGGKEGGFTRPMNCLYKNNKPNNMDKIIKSPYYYITFDDIFDEPSSPQAAQVAQVRNDVLI